MLRLPKVIDERLRFTAAAALWSYPMSLSQEFYDYADEHFGWADTAKTERERAIFLQMAAAWLEVAQQWEADSPPAATMTVRRVDGERGSISA